MTLEIDIRDANEDELASSLADEAERIADMIREGFTSGEVRPAGWWSVVFT